MKLLSIVKSPRSGKKWRALFEHTSEDATKRKTHFHTDFGASGYTDYTMGASAERARLYRQRHEKDLKTNNPTKAGYLSYYLLWMSPNFQENLRHYKNKFHL